jgi:hypothetical protein
VLHQLRDAGNTVVVIEHNLDVIKNRRLADRHGPRGRRGRWRTVVGRARRRIWRLVRRVLREDVEGVVGGGLMGATSHNKELYPGLSASTGHRNFHVAPRQAAPVLGRLHVRLQPVGQQSLLLVEFELETQTPLKSPDFAVAKRQVRGRRP